jgi:hypothetical protein
MIKNEFRIRFGLLAGIFVFILILCLTASDPPFHYSNPRFVTIARIQALTAAYASYVADNGSLPKELNNRDFLRALSGANPRKEIYMQFKPNQTTSGKLVDGWGNPLRISYLSNSDVSILSAGADKVFGTADDIGNQ